MVFNYSDIQFIHLDYLAMQHCETVEKIISTRQGNLFVKIWQPQQTELSKQIPILLFHDSLGCVQLWRDFPEQLCIETNRMIIAYDRHGFGQSDASDTQLSTDFIQQEALVAAELLDQLEISQVIALGHSVGGGMAVSFASQYPFKCVAVITEAAQAYIEQKTLDAFLLQNRCSNSLNNCKNSKNIMQKKHNGFWMLGLKHGFHLHFAIGLWTMTSKHYKQNCSSFMVTMMNMAA
jgi:hypothetical protein